MAVVRPKVQTEYALRLPFTVAASQTTVAGQAVIFSGSDTAIAKAGADSDLAIGIARSAGVAGDVVEVTLFGNVIEEVLVGTGDATRGTKAVLVADGFTNAPAHDSDGTGNEAVYGIFIESGVAGDKVGMLLIGASNRGSAS
jgi:hypothetical protein